MEGARRWREPRSPRGVATGTDLTPGRPVFDTTSAMPRAPTRKHATTMRARGLRCTGAPSCRSPGVVCIDDIWARDAAARTGAAVDGGGVGTGCCCSSIVESTLGAGSAISVLAGPRRSRGDATLESRVGGSARTGAGSSKTVSDTPLRSRSAVRGSSPSCCVRCIDGSCAALGCAVLAPLAIPGRTSMSCALRPLAITPASEQVPAERACVRGALLRAASARRLRHHRARRSSSGTYAARRDAPSAAAAGRGSGGPGERDGLVAVEGASGPRASGRASSRST